MSLLPANELRVLLAHDALNTARAGWRWQGGALREPSSEITRSWRAALAALEALLRTQARPARLHVTLSNRLVRYAFVPWQAGLKGVAVQAYQRDCFVRVYGDGARQWQIAATPPRRGAPGLASAVDAALVSELQALCQRTRAQLADVQPLLAAVVNCWRRVLQGDCFWLVLAEPGYLCLALSQHRTWRAVRTARTGANALAALGQLIERESLLADTDATPTQVFLWAPQFETADMEQVAGLPAVRLGPNAAHPLAALFDCGAGQ
ncbi:hypothetical protein [Massilia horti]|uniref:Uncharacterized protein n=1 Tax=Massilia horti TaxID=2562153 RepID=A0A4Y9T2W4_9BURK|nr:hypothetical protein [Massilia horti]TFW32308.1 hypothetical protein E4O92_10080 [Massilia horti]